MYVCMYVCIYVCVCIYVSMHALKYVSTYICVYLCVYVLLVRIATAYIRIIQEIIEMNNALKLALYNGATMKMVAGDWEFLQVKECMYVCMYVCVYF